MNTRIRDRIVQRAAKAAFKILRYPDVMSTWDDILDGLEDDVRRDIVTFLPDVSECEAAATREEAMNIVFAVDEFINHVQHN